MTDQCVSQVQRVFICRPFFQRTPPKHNSAHGHNDN